VKDREESLKRGIARRFWSEDLSEQDGVWDQEVADVGGSKVEERFEGEY